MVSPSGKNITDYDKGWRDATIPKSSNLLNGGEPAIANSFLFEIDGVEIGIFKEVKGLEMKIGAQEIVEGGQNNYVHRAIGRTTWPNIILRRGMTEGNALFEWMNNPSRSGLTSPAKVKLATGAITAINTVGERLRAWNLKGVYPVNWRGPEFGVDSRTPLEEELEISHQGFTSKTF